MRFVKAVVLAASVAALSGVVAPPARAEVSFDLAYSNLSRHGSWLVSAQYGRVWQPAEYDPDWNPYYDGHWVDTDLGWTWVSDYEWGAVPYHYGTWYLDPRLGWVWIPGDVWAPSWVVFRTGPDYIGWAPVPPGFSVGVSFDAGATAGFTFVPCRDFLAPRIRTAIVPAARTRVIIDRTTVVNNFAIRDNVVVNRGPDAGLIEKATGRPVRPQPIERVARVAPFEHVSRAQLAVPAERIRRGVRVAEPVRESHAEPVVARHERPDAPARPRAPEPSIAQRSAPSPHAVRERPQAPPAASPAAQPPKKRKPHKKEPNGDNG